MAIDPKILEQLRQEPDMPELDLGWLGAQTAPDVAAKPGRRGLTLSEINVGAYGDAPERSEHNTIRIRGSVPSPDAVRIGYFIPNKGDIWSDNAGRIYEEGVQRQWSSATDIPWDTIQPLPDVVEEAICQICTFLTEVEFVAGDAPGRWIGQISPDHFETALFLITQVVDEARHLDVFRKRALANGCGLLEAGGMGRALRNIMDAKDFSEMSALMHLVGEGFVQTMFRTGEFIATNEAEKTIFQLCAQDESRHVGFGVMHLRYVLEHQPERREEFHSYLDKAEELFGHPTSANVAFQESLMITLGGGDTDKGLVMLMALQKKQVTEYLHRLKVAGMPERRERLHPGMAMFL